MSMNVLIYAIGGEFNEKVVGMVADPNTANSVLRMVELTGGSGVSLHGNRGEVILSGDCTFSEAREALGIFLGIRDVVHCLEAYKALRNVG